MSFRSILLSLLLFALALPCMAQTVTLTGPASLNPGKVGTFIAAVTNSLSPRAPITLTATCSYHDWTGGQFQATADPVILTITQPLTFASISLALPAGLSYVSGSAASTVPVTGTLTGGVLTLSLGAGVVLIEGQQLVISFGLKAQ